MVYLLVIRINIWLTMDVPLRDRFSIIKIRGFTKYIFFNDIYTFVVECALFKNSKVRFLLRVMSSL